MSFIQEALCDNLVKIVCSNPFDKNINYHKITLRPVNRGTRLFHIEKLTKTQAFHENVEEQHLGAWLKTNVEGLYKQICLFFTEKKCHLPFF